MPLKHAALQVSSSPDSLLQHGVEWLDPTRQPAQAVPVSRNKIRYAIVSQSSPSGDYSSVSASGAVHCMTSTRNQACIKNQPEVFLGVGTQTASYTSSGLQQNPGARLPANHIDAFLESSEDDTPPWHDIHGEVQLPEYSTFPEAKGKPFNLAEGNDAELLFTTVLVSFLPARFSMEDMHKQLDMLGLRGTYISCTFNQVVSEKEIQGQHILTSSAQCLHLCVRWNFKAMCLEVALSLLRFKALTQT